MEPIELVAERQGCFEGPLRYGEGFRLRAAGCRGLYLGYARTGGIAWKGGKPPTDARWSAHGGELGKPLLFGKALLLRRVCSPPPSECSDSEGEAPQEEEEEHPVHRRRSVTMSLLFFFSFIYV